MDLVRQFTTLTLINGRVSKKLNIGRLYSSENITDI